MRSLRAVPNGFGRVRLANYIYRRNFEHRSELLRNTSLGDGSCFFLDLAEWPQAQAFLLREYDPDTVRFVIAHLPRDGVFVDAGAHVGLISLQVLQRRGSASIHAFEPHPKRGEQFARNIGLNSCDGQVHFNPVGLSDINGEVEFDFRRHAITDSATTIRVIRLDDYLDEHVIERVDVIKLDIEGHELQALRGAERALADKRIRAVTLEAMEDHGDTTAAADVLRGFGYQRVPLPSSPIASLRRGLRMGRGATNVGYVAIA
jgi:FkbM family methyltransferase